MLVKIKGGSICKTPRSDGRYVAHLHLFGKKRDIYARSLYELEQAVAKIITGGKYPEYQRKQKKTSESKKEYTFREWFFTYVKLYKTKKVKPSTMKGIVDIGNTLCQYFGDTKLKNLDAIELQDFLANYPAKRRVRQFYIYLNASLEKARKLKIIKDNPCDTIELPDYQAETIHAITRSEQALLLQALKGNAYEELFRFALGTGCRIGEILALTPEDFKDGSVTISKNVVFIKGERITQTPKTKAGNRTIPVPTEAMPTMNSPLVFPFTLNSVKLMLKRITKKINIHCSIHMLRHTYSTRLEELGVPAKIKQYLMGHASIKMTQNVYTEVQQEYLKKQIKTIEKVLDTDS